MYYKNNKCEVLTRFEDRAVISLLTGIYSDSDSEQVEPIFNEIIVEAKDLHEEPIIVKDKLEAIEKARFEFEKLKKDWHIEQSKLKAEAEKELKSIESKAKQYDGLLEMYRYLSGEYQYAVLTNYYRFDLVKLDECKSDKELAAVSFRVVNKEQKIKMYLEKYSDGSGDTRYECHGFKTLEEAKEFAKNYMHNYQRGIDSSMLNVCSKFNITSEKIETHRRIEANIINNQLLTDIARKEKELEELNKRRNNA